MVVIFGRDEVIRYLMASTSSIAILAGDAGVGKTAVLAEVAAAGGSARPTSVQRAPGALQEAILQALSLAVATAELTESRVERFGRVLTSTVERAVSAHLRDVGRTVCGWLVDAVRARVGDSLVDSVQRLANEFAISGEQELSFRLRAATDPDVVAMLVRFAAEVRSFCHGDGVLLLLIDDLDRLSSDDSRRLADLADELSSAGTRIIAAFQTSTSDLDEALLQLERDGVDVLHIEGLAASTIESWLRAESLDPMLATQIEQLTNGYPLDIAACLELILSGEALPEQSPNPDFSRVLRVATQLALRNMPGDARTAVIRLAPYSLPMNDAQVASILGVGVPEWGSIQLEFLKQRLFIGNPPWFHNRRRRIVNELLPAAQLEQSRQSAITELASRIDQAPQTDVTASMVVELAAIIEQTDEPTRTPDVDHTLSEIGAANHAELALLGALIELTEASTPVIEIQHVVAHAHDSFGVAINQSLGAAAETLSSRSYIGSARNDDAHLIGTGFGASLAFQFAVGRIAKELGRRPIPGLATQVFEASIRPSMSGFTIAQYGIGDPDIQHLARAARDLQIHPAPGQADMSGFARPSVLIKAVRNDVPLYAAVAWSDVSERDNAIAQLLASGTSADEVRVLIAHPHPAEKLTSRRFVRSLGRALGAPVTQTNADSAARAHRLAEPIGHRESLQMRLDTRRAMRARMNAVELLAAGLTDDAPGFLFGPVPGGGVYEAAVVGFGSVVEADEHSSPFGSLAHRMELIRAAGRRVGRVSYHSRWDPTINPVAHEVVRISTLLRAYNDLQRHSVHVPFTAEHLSAAIGAANRDCEEVANDLRIVLEQDQKPAERYFYFLSGARDDPGFVPGATTSAVVVVGTVEHETQAFVSIEKDLGAFAPRGGGSFEAMCEAWAELITERFGVTTAVTRVSQRSVRGAVASALGYEEADVWLDR